jgi:hypothetical protein
VHPTLLKKSCKQSSVLSNTHQLQISSLSLLSYLCDDCHKQAILISDSHGNSNRCTPYMGKSDQHTTRIPRSVRVWSQTIRISRGQCIATFHESSIDLDGSHGSREKKAPDTIPITSANRSTDPYPVSLPSQPIMQ